MKRLALCIGSSLTASLLLLGGSCRAAGYDEDVMRNFLDGCVKAALAIQNSSHRDTCIDKPVIDKR